MPPHVRLRLLRWFALLGVVLLAAAVDGRLTAQDKSKKSQPDKKEVEDPKAGKPKPVPRLDDQPDKTGTSSAEAPGVPPPPDTLVVAVRSLPVFMSPSLARTDSEKFALDLLFEGLVRPVADSVAGVSYEPALARELPRLVTRGREFTLTEAFWADPANPDFFEPVTTADVRSTVDKLRGRKELPGGEVGRLIEAVDVTDSKERCRVILKQGHPEPLALMTFKVLPSFRSDDEAFARQPIGSGPFMYAGTAVEGGRKYARFPANPAYGRRPGHANLPRMREVRMLESPDPVADFRKKLANLVLTTRTGDLAILAPPRPPRPETGTVAQGQLEPILPGGKAQSLASRRIYFLAVNHAWPALGGAGGAELRRLIAHAIQRDAILTESYRVAGYTDHQPLTGPFPPDTWPCDPLAGRLDEPDTARDIARRIKPPAALDLKYPAGDPAIEHACQMIQKQLAEIQVPLKLIPLEPDELRRKVEVETDFHLAYWHYDYTDDWFSPAGLFDPKAQGSGNRNFMRYQPSADFGATLARCQDRRDFGEVRKAMQRLHAVFRTTEMPFIPMWHLDTHVLVADRLQVEPAVALLDPLAPFVHVDQWRFRP